MNRIARELLWAVAFASVALSVTWTCFGFEWAERWSFYAPYSICIESPWLMALELFVGLCLVRLFLIRRRLRRRPSG